MSSWKYGRYIALGKEINQKIVVTFAPEPCLATYCNSLTEIVLMQNKK